MLVEIVYCSLSSSKSECKHEEGDGKHEDDEGDGMLVLDALDCEEKIVLEVSIPTKTHHPRRAVDC